MANALVARARSAHQARSAAVYTELTDVIIEINGLMTYDRKVVKFDTAKLAELHRKLIQSVPR